LPPCSSPSAARVTNWAAVLWKLIFGRTYPWAG
jgi:hypothetical protein